MSAIESAGPKPAALPETQVAVQKKQTDQAIAVAAAALAPIVASAAAAARAPEQTGQNVDIAI
jgi:hypothetical protein